MPGAVLLLILIVYASVFVEFLVDGMGNQNTICMPIICVKYTIEMEVVILIVPLSQRQLTVIELICRYFIN